MQQVLVVHGGDSFDTHEEYIASLHGKVVSLDDLAKRGWKRNLQTDLGEQFRVIAPSMPNASNARYAEWKIIFKKWFALVDDDVILVGHSLGGIFLAKYLSEETVAKRIKATFLVAAPNNHVVGDSLTDFILPNSLDGLAHQAGQLYLYHSHDDAIVPFSNFERYASMLPHAKTRIFDNRGHFFDETVPELIDDIRSL